MAVEVRSETPRARIYLTKLRAQAVKLMKFLALSRYELSILLTDDISIRTLNREFRGKNAATDVLSFPQLEAELLVNGHSSLPNGKNQPEGPAALGDVVISVETAGRQADQLGIGVEDRLSTLLIHGLLHLLGYDHEISEAEAERMFVRERELATELVNGSGRKGRQAAGTDLLLDGAWPPAAVPARGGKARRTRSVKHAQSAQ